MGVYDYFKGACPKCNGQIDHKDGKSYGSIQTKLFNPVPTLRGCGRTFKPGKIVPFAPRRTIYIGETCCCNTPINAIFEGNLLKKYVVAWLIN
jgi:hypothetical protein